MVTLTMPPRECRVHGVEMIPSRVEMVCLGCGHSFGPGELDRQRDFRDTVGLDASMSHCPLCSHPL